MADNSEMNNHYSRRLLYHKQDSIQMTLGIMEMIGKETFKYMLSQ